MGAGHVIRHCRYCGGRLLPLGKLGRRLHYRCQACGLGWSRPTRKPKGLPH